MARPANTEQRRQEIVDALLRVMAARGYGGASTTAIAQEAGLAPGLIHYYFMSKQEILLEAIAQLRAVLERRHAELSRAADTPAARLKAFVDARLASGEGANAAAVASWVIIGAEAIRQPEVREAYQSAMQAQMTLLQTLIGDFAQSRLSPERVLDLAGIVLAAMEGTFQLSVSASALMPKDYAAKTVMALIAAYVDYPPPPISRSD